MDAIERAKAVQAHNAKIARAVTLLEPYRNNEVALWDHLPEALEVAFGVPLNKQDSHDLMPCGVIVGSLLVD